MDLVVVDWSPLLSMCVILLLLWIDSSLFNWDQVMELDMETYKVWMIFTKVIYDLHGLGCCKLISPIVDCGLLFFYEMKWFEMSFYYVERCTSEMRHLVQPQIPSLLRGSVEICGNFGMNFPKRNPITAWEARLPQKETIFPQERIKFGQRKIIIWHSPHFMWHLFGQAITEAFEKYI